EVQAVAPVFLLNRGGGRFVDATASLFDGTPPAVEWNRQMVVADFNGDHRPDIFIADMGIDNTALNPDYHGQQNKLILSEPNGKYMDATANLPQRFTFTHSAAAADVNGDGSVDIFENNIGGLGRSHDQAEILLKRRQRPLHRRKRPTTRFPARRLWQHPLLRLRVRRRERRRTPGSHPGRRRRSRAIRGPAERRARLVRLLRVAPAEAV